MTVKLFVIIAVPSLLAIPEIPPSSVRFKVHSMFCMWRSLVHRNARTIDLQDSYDLKDLDYTAIMTDEEDTALIPEAFANHPHENLALTIVLFRRTSSPSPNSSNQHSSSLTLTLIGHPPKGIWGLSSD